MQDKQNSTNQPHPGHSHEHHTHHHHSHPAHHHHSHQNQNKKWEDQHPNYSSIDSSPQTFYYTLSNMLKLNQAKNILEVGCGAGKLLSTALDLKNPQAVYTATDISQGMVNQAKKRLQHHFKKYKSTLTFQEWLDTQKLKFQVQNGQNIIGHQNIKFDRIISNMVLCHADDAQKMLRNWFENASQDCLLGFSLLGDPLKNPLILGLRQSIVEAGQKLPDTRPPYYWYDKISALTEACGWEIILEWQQNSVFPFLQYEDQNLKKFFKCKVPEKARESFEKKLMKLFKQDKCGVQSWCKSIIARKRKQ